MSVSPPSPPRSRDCQVWMVSRHVLMIVMIGLSSWLVNAFNDEWHRIADPVPDDSMWEKVKRSLPMLVK